MPVEQLHVLRHTDRRSAVTRQSPHTPAERNTVHSIATKKETETSRDCGTTPEIKYRPKRVEATTFLPGSGAHFWQSLPGVGFVTRCYPAGNPETT
jgi:hypothetical protein